MRASRRLARSRRRGIKTAYRKIAFKYCTQFHIAASHGIHESTANRIITKVENVLSASGRFALPKRQEPQAAEHELVVVVIDSTQTLAERLKKSEGSSTVHQVRVTKPRHSG